VSEPEAPAQHSLVAGQTPKLSVQDLSVTYTSGEGDPVLAVETMSFSVLDKPGVGEIVVFLGPSGCGKSTMLRCLAGLLEPTQGKVLIDGQDVRGPSRDRGMVFQAYTSFAWLKVRENVEYGLKLAGVGADERKRRALEALEQVGLAAFAERYPKELSGGMKQRVAIARTLVNQPRLVLMDEPFGALDPQTRWDMQSLVLDISRKLDNTMVFVTHDVSEAVYLADSVFILSARPARILSRIEVPFFEERKQSIKETPKFREIESQILEQLRSQPGHLRVTHG
jgi:NitT/TauT family transport system ATP-binding protein